MPAVPVLYYHRVNRVDARLGITPELFAAQVRALAAAGWRSLHTDELLAGLAGQPLPPRSLLITFDDGFADNLLYAFPALAAAGMKAVINLIAGRVWDGPVRAEPAPGEPPLRPFDRANKASLAGDHADYLSTAEIKQLASSGLVEFGSHTMDHAPAFRSGRAADFALSESLHWAREMILGPGFLPGAPLYETGSAAAVRRFAPATDYAESLRRAAGLSDWKQVKETGKDEWRRRLLKAAAELGPAPGARETEAEAATRVRENLTHSREIIAAAASRPCRSLSWPWGHYSRFGLAAARDAGFETGFTTETGAVMPGQDMLALPRFRVSSRTSPTALCGLVAALRFKPLARAATLFRKSGEIE